MSNTDEGLEARKQEFLQQYKALIDEFKLDFMSRPIWIPDGQGGWKLVIETIIADTTDHPVPSPFSV